MRICLHTWTIQLFETFSLLNSKQIFLMKNWINLYFMQSLIYFFNDKMMEERCPKPDFYSKDFIEILYDPYFNSFL